VNESKIIVALDGIEWELARRIARSLRGIVWGYKVNDALIDKGLDCVRELKSMGNVFADPKLHDVPSTVKNAAKKLVKAGADVITVHAVGGFDMMRAACEEAGPAIAAVTVLTSLADEDCIDVYGGFRHAMVEKFARLADNAGVQKLICGVPDLGIPSIQKLFTIVPGIRIEAVAGDDQKAFGIPKSGTYGLVVVGRPITRADDPVAAAKAFNQTLADA
jgi:orotidine-5'-phosphate decarboxylase